MTTYNRSVWIWLLCACAAGCHRDEEEITTRFPLAGHHYDSGQMTQYELPDVLREVSGLALTNRGELLAHNDEQAIVYRLDPARGRVLGSFSFGERPLSDDFEGITTLGRRVFLITSSGTLYEARMPIVDETDDPAITLPASYNRYEVELPCEVEGLATRSTSTLLAVCKNLYDGDDVLRIYAWSIPQQRYLPDPYLSLREEDFAGVTSKLHRLRPSGITVTDAGDLVIVGRHGKSAALLEIDSDGSVVSLHELPERRRHPQPEGISFTRTGWLLIADEGAKADQDNRRGRLGVYRPD